jgi:hypothetical protein
MASFGHGPPGIAAVLVLAAQGNPIAEALLRGSRAGRAHAGVAARARARAAMEVAQRSGRGRRRGCPRTGGSAEGSSLESLRRAGLARIAEAGVRAGAGGLRRPRRAAARAFPRAPAGAPRTRARVTAVGAGAARASDGSLLVVVLLLEESAVRDLREMESATERRQPHPRAARAGGARPQRDADQTARAHSEDMLRRHYFDHQDPRGRKPSDRVSAAGVAWTRVTENLAMSAGMDDPVATAVEGWMDSRGHRANILDPQVTHTGVGIAEDKDGGYTFTQLFVTLRPNGSNGK